MNDSVNMGDIEILICGGKGGKTQLVKVDEASRLRRYVICQVQGATSLPGWKASETPSTSRIRAAPARTHFAEACLVFSCAVNT